MANPGFQPDMFSIEIDENDALGCVRGGMGGPLAQNGGAGDGSGGSGGSGGAQESEHAINLDIEIQV